jgi:hypothetical protein
MIEQRLQQLEHRMRRWQGVSAVLFVSVIAVFSMGQRKGKRGHSSLIDTDRADRPQLHPTAGDSSSIARQKSKKNEFSPNILIFHT